MGCGTGSKEGTAMPAYKDKAKGTWYASFYYEDWTGKKVKKMKRGFPTKREALEWERTFLLQQTADLEMTFENFVAVYVADMKGRIKENTWGTKEHILYKKLVPYFGKRKMCDIHSKEVIAWQNEMLNYRDKNGKPYSPVYLKTLHNQLSAVFNHAVRHYNLKVNKAWVLKLATDLRSHGVNAILDQWDLRVGSDLRFFMEQGLSEANLVLCICSKAYVDKFNSGNGGSGYEGAIMTQPLLRDVKTDYIISVVRNNESDKKVPTALGSKLYID